ncbi:MAG: transposase, partial [Duganella sp.]
MTNLVELDTYLERLCDVLGHMDRRTSLKDYCQALMLPIARKSVEPLAAHIEPMQVRAKH